MTSNFTFQNGNNIVGGYAGPSGTSYEPFGGNIDKFSFWSKELSQLEIQQYMNCSPTGSELDLVGYWDFEDGSSSTAIDLSSNGNDGSINGSTYDTNVPTQFCQLTNTNG